MANSKNNQDGENVHVYPYSRLFATMFTMLSAGDMSSRQISVQQLGVNNCQANHRHIFKVKTFC
jgi:hypothetical protein